MLYCGGELMSNDNNDSSGSSVSSENVYKERAEPVLVSPPKSYSELDSISVDTSRPFSYST